MTKIKDKSTIDVKEAVIGFGELNDIKVDNIELIIKFLQESHGNVYFKTLVYAMTNFSGGQYDHIKKPYKLTAIFMSSLIDEYMRRSRNSSTSTPSYQQEYVPSRLQSRKEILFQWCQDNDVQYSDIYGFMVVNRDTDRMNAGEIIEKFNDK